MNQYALYVVPAYFILLFGAGYILSKNAGFSSYFNANRNFSWIWITIGMIGDSLSGVTFISVPGKVHTEGFQYLQVVIGYMAGYWLIAFILLPLYYRHNMISVYEWLGKRFHPTAQKAGSIIFIISRLSGAAARLYLSVWVFHHYVFKNTGTHFLFSVLIVLLLIYLYTRKGGLKVLIYTDTFQSMVLFTALAGSVIILWNSLSAQGVEVLNTLTGSGIKIFNFSTSDPHYFLKDFLGGMGICLAMTGLDQNMMQKNLSCRRLSDAQKNMKTFSVVILFVNVLFLLLGYLLSVFYQFHSPSSLHETNSDALFPIWAMHYAPLSGIILFVFGITAATFNSADSVMTTLTTSFYVDILGMKINQENNRFLKNILHTAFATAIFLCIILFYLFNKLALIDTTLLLGGITYGPLLGLFLFGLISNRKLPSLSVILGIISGLSLSLFLFYYFKSHPQFYNPGLEFILWNAGIHLIIFFFLSARKPHY